jgi:acyl-[acyl-carrier-protein]-phospholipid O-acyltransferase/long-chain-fatty-acid--[acyl-carrier-protein] ligase
MGGLFIIPLNALIQFHAKDKELAQVLAGNNLVQNIAMTGFLLLTVFFSLAGFSSLGLLIIIAIVAVLGGIYTVYMLPQSLVRILFTGLLSQFYRVDVQGMKNIPGQGGVLLLGNHISFIDWAIVQIASPRPVRFVMLRSIYELWYLNWFFKLNGCIPIEPGPSSEEALKTIAGLLDNGEVVCLFPEGAITHTGELGEFRHGYEKACALTRKPLVIVPFYLQGLWGSKFSRADRTVKSPGRKPFYRELLVAFGKALPQSVRADELKIQVGVLGESASRVHALEFAA